MIQTSYFAKYKEDNGISIARFTPKWFKGETYIKLAPDKELLLAFKNSEITQKEFIELYYLECLKKLDAKEVYNDLQGKTLLCVETSDKFCHRHIIAVWLKRELGIEVNEYGV